MNLTHKRLAIAVIAASTVAMTGCYTFRYTTNRPVTGSFTSEQWHNQFINGLVDASGPVNLTAICPGGFALVEHQMTFLNGLLSWAIQAALTAVVSFIPYVGSVAGVWFTIWTPTTVRVQCAAHAGGAEALPPAVPPDPQRQLAGR